MARFPCSSADAALLFLRRRYLYWDATDDEMAMALPGDELLRRADLTATGQSRFAAPLRVSGHGLAQLGQGRGGFYSYDFLENLVGCDIYGADRIVPEWQSINVGGEVNLYPGVGLLVAHVEPGRALVLRGAVPLGRTPPPYDSTWATLIISTGGQPPLQCSVIACPLHAGRHDI